MQDTPATDACIVTGVRWPSQASCVLTKTGQNTTAPDSPATRPETLRCQRTMQIIILSVICFK